MSVTVYHNPRCSKSRASLKLLEDRGVDLKVVEYLKQPPTREELESLLSMLGIEPRALMRKGEDIYKEAGLDNPQLENAELISAMIEHPILIERPIIVSGGKAVIGRPPEKALELLG